MYILGYLLGASFFFWLLLCSVQILVPYKFNLGRWFQRVFRWRRQVVMMPLAIVLGVIMASVTNVP